MQLTMREANGREPPTSQKATRSWCLCVSVCARARAHAYAPPSVYVALCLCVFVAPLPQRHFVVVCVVLTGYLTVTGGRFPTTADGTQQ